jgi:hypothetical protein
MATLPRLNARRGGSQSFRFQLRFIDGAAGRPTLDTALHATLPYAEASVHSIPALQRAAVLTPQLPSLYKLPRDSRVVQGRSSCLAAGHWSTDRYLLFLISFFSTFVGRHARSLFLAAS